MLKEIELMGKWWLPSKPENVVSGKLTFTQEYGARLELIGYFEKFPTPEADTFDIVLGFSSTGSPITLVNCFITSSKLSMPGFTVATIFANQLYIGAHFKKPEDVKFNTVRVAFHNLNEWVRLISFTETLRKDKQIIEYIPPKRINFDLGTFELSLGFNRSQSKINSFKHVHIEQEAYFKVAFEKEKHITEIDEVHHLTNFLTLAMGQPTLTASYIGRSNKITEKFQDISIPIDIQVYAQQIFTDTKPLKRNLVNFWLEDIDIFTERLTKWYEKKEKLKTVNNLFFGEIYRRAPYAEQRFLNMTQALEALHRRNTGNDLLDKRETRRAVKELIKLGENSLDPKYIERFRPRLNYSHEFFFIERLESLFSALDTVDKDFLNKVKDTRNYLTHYDDELKEKSFQGIEIHYAAKKLKKALEKLLLLEVGVTK